MFKKVLVSEDMQDICKGVHSSLCELGINDIHLVQYCDDAYLKIKKAEQEGAPFELIITDLSFKADWREQKISSGEDLIEVVKNEFPHVKIIVYSVKDKVHKVKYLLTHFNINGYVCKTRRGLTELKKAIFVVYDNKVYLSAEVSNAQYLNKIIEINDYDIILLEQLSKGFSQEYISNLLKQKNIKPNSLSSIEKRLNKLRIEFKANNAIHLIAILKDSRLI